MNKMTVVGAGVMGRGITYDAAVKGFEVRLSDISEDALKSAEMSIKRLIDKGVTRGTIPEDEIDSISQSISYHTDLKEAAGETDIVIEAVIENMDIKIDVFKQLDQYTQEDTILATNTSTMSPTEIGAQTSRPDKVIAMHFFNPVYKMKLIEVVKGLDTSEETVQKVKEIGFKMKKEPVEINEFPGFVTSRMNCLIGNEAMNMLMQGVSSAEGIDKAMKLGLNHPMGPLELADLVGLDTRLRNMEYLHQTLGEQYRPCPILAKYVKAGKLGRKSGEGFYTYS